MWWLRLRAAPRRRHGDRRWGRPGSWRRWAFFGDRRPSRRSRGCGAGGRHSSKSLGVLASGGAFNGGASERRSARALAELPSFPTQQRVAGPATSDRSPWVLVCGLKRIQKLMKFSAIVCVLLEGRRGGERCSSFSSTCLSTSKADPFVAGFWS